MQVLRERSGAVGASTPARSWPSRCYAPIWWRTPTSWSASSRSAPHCFECAAPMSWQFGMSSSRAPPSPSSWTTSMAGTYAISCGLADHCRLRRWRPWEHASRKGCPLFIAPESFTGTSSRPTSCSARTRAEAAIPPRRLPPVSPREGPCQRRSSLGWRILGSRASVTPFPPPTSPGPSAPRCTWLRRSCRCRRRRLLQTSTRWGSCSTR